ncbi:hypothetical protein B0F90DRAFT_1922198 [Multifurca ochricompacta]|uniref:Uncharacterized protein n=1 Tax=Multifurca ochricompacta TaxID=376703 RepID=A0AAD4MFD5_9AGAM|nr:hypothetical protein B0F90DRAFT_1922198 [Multifurca ochricompacta]
MFTLTLAVLCRLVRLLHVITANTSLTLSSIHSEEAVEYDELKTFLRLNETWDESIGDTRPTLPVKPIGVPGASSPSQMAKPAHRALFNASPASSPLRGAGAVPVDKGSVTEDDLVALVEELGLNGEEAGDLVKGLSDFTEKTDKRRREATEGEGAREVKSAKSRIEKRATETDIAGAST